jgi:hypothetical protein
MKKERVIITKKITQELSMKTLFFGLMIVLSASTYASTYNCDAEYSADRLGVKFQGGVAASGLEYAGAEIEPLDRKNGLEISLKSTGRGNTMPKNRFAYALLIGGEVILSGAQVYDLLPENINLQTSSPEANVTINCTLVK